MTDYAEMCRRLRALAEGCPRLSQQGYDLLNNAADAIEELQQIANHHEEAAHDYWKDVCYYMERVPKWIPVTERLPETCAAVLVCLHWGSDNDEITVGEYWKNSKSSPGWGTFDPYVTHWMPLPETPKEEGET